MALNSGMCFLRAQTTTSGRARARQDRQTDRQYTGPHDDHVEAGGRLLWCSGAVRRLVACSAPYQPTNLKAHSPRARPLRVLCQSTTAPNTKCAQAPPALLSLSHTRYGMVHGRGRGRSRQAGRQAGRPK